MQTREERKQALITKILAGSTYQPDSALYRSVAHSLMLLPLHALSKLDILLSCRYETKKSDDAA